MYDEWVLVPALASALREREDTLQLCASLIAEDRMDELKDILKPYGREYVEMRRRQKYILDLTKGFDTENLEMLRRGLMRMPRRVSTAHRRRAGVVLPLCNVHGIPSILFEKRSQTLRKCMNYHEPLQFFYKYIYLFIIRNVIYLRTL